MSDDLLTRGIVNVIPSVDKLAELLKSGKKLNIYFGIDPTATKIHIGHAFPLRKLRVLLDLGHNVTFLIGDFTALIGDTSDKESERPILTKEEIIKNFTNYKALASKFIDFSKVKIVYNSEWLSKLTFEDIVKLTQHFSVGDFVGRELIKKRIEAGKKVRLDETLYPVMQGYDSYHLDTDIQIGAADQTFNMQAGRNLIKDLKGKESFVLVTAYLSGTDGKKMSKTSGNAIWIDDAPGEMYGKVMSVRDDQIIEYWTLATNVADTKIREIKDRLSSGENPMIIKSELAHQIVGEIYGREEADKAATSFKSTFQQKDLPVEPELLELPANLPESLPIVTFLSQTKLVPSMSEAKRLVKGGAIEVNGQPVGHSDIINPSSESVIRIGKKKFVKVVKSE